MRSTRKLINEDELEQIAKYYLTDSKGLKPTNIDKLISPLIELLLQIFSLIGGLGYIKPARDFADGNKYLEVLFPIGTFIPAYAILVLTTKNLLQSMRNEIHPNNLKKYMHTMSHAKLAFKYVGISIGAFLTAIPLFLTAIEYKITSIEQLDIAFDAIFLGANILLHLPPIKIMVEDKNPIYRLPILPFTSAYYSYRWIQQRRMTYRQQQQLTLHVQQQRNYMELKNTIIRTISESQQLLIKNGFIFDKSHLAYKLLIPREFTSFDRDHNAIDQLVALIKHTNKKKTISQNSNQFLSWCDWLAGGSIYLAGGFMAIISLVGYSADPFKEIPNTEPFDKAPDWTNDMVSISSDYVFNTLFFYLTANAALRSYKYLKSLFIETNTSKAPLIFKLYPKTFSVFMLINTVLCPFAGGAAAELIRANFSGKKWGPYRPFLIDIALFGLAYLAFFVISDAGNMILTMFSNSFGDNDTKGAIQLITRPT